MEANRPTGKPVQAVASVTCGGAAAQRGDKWVYPKSANVLRAVRLQLQQLRYYIQKQRLTVAKTIAICPVLEECKGAARLRGTPQFVILGKSRT